MSIPLQAIVLLVVLVLLARVFWALFVAECRLWLLLAEVLCQREKEEEEAGQ